MISLKLAHRESTDVNCLADLARWLIGDRSSQLLIKRIHYIGISTDL